MTKMSEHRGRGVPRSDFERQTAISRADVVGVVQAARELGIPEPTLRGWRRTLPETNADKVRRTQYDNKTRSKTVALAQKFGAREAAEKTGIPYQTLIRWVSKPDKRRTVNTYSDDFRKQAVARARSTSTKQAAQELKISKSTLGSWIRESQPIQSRVTRRSFTKEQVAEAVALAGRIGVILAAEQLGISEGSVRHWQAKVQLGPVSGRVVKSVKRTSKSYSAESKKAALHVVETEGYLAASRLHDVERPLLRKWAKAEGVRPPQQVGQGKAWDVHMRWLTRTNSHMEGWRVLAEEWLTAHKDALPARLTSLTKLFQDYILKQRLTTQPEELLSRFYEAPPTDPAFPSTRHGKVCLNYSSEFLEWVLRTHFSERDEQGRVHIDPLFRNPLTKKSFKGDSFDSESRYSALPYEFLVECRRIIAQGPNFRDWLWARTQLGVEEGRQGGGPPEWFEVPFSLIDMEDPDCVWRRHVRSRAAGGARYEMWSPVRWVAQLMRCNLPTRTLQVRLLDSGEADTWRYNLVNGAGEWTLNTTHLRRGTQGKPLQQGVFRRPGADLLDRDVKLPSGWSNAVVYVNTNKTADAKKSGAQKGYSFPWVSGKGIENDVFYWLHKLRNWQEKYNPLAHPTSWKKLDSRHIPRKSDVQLAGFPDTCFLFRLPEERGGNAYLPLADGMLDHTWFSTLEELERRLRLKGVKNTDGSAIQLVVSENRRAKRTLFPPHSVRVSIATALADAGAPLTVIMRVLGHSRLAMTIYYRKRGQVGMAMHLEVAVNTLEAKGAALLTNWLRNNAHTKLMESVIGNNADSLLGAIAKNPAARNPVGWMPLSLGLCIAGGNVSPMEGGEKNCGGCYNGGPNLGTASKPKFSPVPGGARNCVRCRWLVTAAHYLPALVDRCNLALFHFDEAKNSLLLADRMYQDLVAEQISQEAVNGAGPTAAELKNARAKVDVSAQRLSDRAEDVVASMRLIERCRLMLAESSDAAAESRKLLAVGSKSDIEVALRDVGSEFEQLDLVCESLEIYPEAQAPTAILRRSQLMDAALALEGAQPIFFTLNAEDQLRLGNRFIQQMAHACNPANPALGRRKVVEIVDARKCLSTHLHLDVKSLIPQTPPPYVAKNIALQ